MANITYTQPSNGANLATTGLNSLANGSQYGSSATTLVDNSGGATGSVNATGDLYLNLSLYVAAQGTARSAGAYVSIALCAQVDGTDYCDSTSPCPTPLAQFNLDAAITARYVTLSNLPIPPGKFFLVLTNNTGQSFAASGNILYGSTHHEQVV
jgi:hypothetical protein